MKKSLFFLTIILISFFYSELASGQWVVCNKYPWRDRNIYVTAPYFSVDLIVDLPTDINHGWADAGAYWGPYRSRISCDHAGCSQFRNIGAQTGGGINVYIFCGTDGDGYAKAELWSW